MTIYIYFLILIKQGKKQNSLFSPEPTLDQLISQFQLVLYRYYQREGQSLYDPTAMRDFAEKHAPGLFDMILKSIKRDDQRLSHDRESLHLQRTVSLRHIFSYFR